MRKDKLKMSNLNLAVDHFNKYGPYKVYPAEKAKILKFPKKKTLKILSLQKQIYQKNGVNFLRKET